ncbi:MAG: N-formylglutamate amidohydrolase [Alphaproteobacteria bacterium]
MSVNPAPTPAGFEIVPAADPVVPLVLSSPHSGRTYSPDFVAGSRLDAQAIRRSEDSFVDELFAGGPPRGAALLRALFPRAYIDVNREPYELDPAMFEDALPPYANTGSLRVRGGLGTIARVVASGEEIYRRKLAFAEAEARVRDCYRPYHSALRRLLDEARARFGRVVLLDCHSMPSVGGPMDRDPGAPRVDCVLGDRHGSACHPDITAAAERTLRASGYVVQRNTPYAGGFITRHYGHPETGVHALQIEINRALYMDETRFSRGVNLAVVQGHMSELIGALARAAPVALAAE